MICGNRKKWSPIFDGEIVLVPLLNGGTATIDAADLELVAAYTWFRQDHTHTCYAGAVLRTKPVRMHRVILGVTDRHRIVDHKDRDGLNNRRGNLRECTKAQNGQNRWERNAKSGLKGAAYHRASGLFHSTIRVGDRQLSLGYFKTREDAAAAYDVAAALHFGEFAVTNKSVGAL